MRGETRRKPCWCVTCAREYLARRKRWACIWARTSRQGRGSAFISSGSGSSILGWIPIRIQGFNDQKLKIITAGKKLIFFWSKTTIYLSLGLHKERPRYGRGLQLSKVAIQHFKTWTLKKKFYFCGSFLPSWIRIRIPNPDPDPMTRLNPDPIRIRNPASRTQCAGWRAVRRCTGARALLRSTRWDITTERS